MASIPALRRGLAFALGVALVALPLPAVAQDADPATMSSEDKLARAKQLYQEGLDALDAENPALALTKFEQAYNDYAQDLHLFNFNIGTAAFELNDCIKAKKAFERFLDLVPKHPARKEAQEKLLEIERTKCAETQAPAEPTPDPVVETGPTPSKTGDNFDAPVLEKNKPGSGDDDGEGSETEPPERRGKLIGGSVLTGFGVAGLIGGAVSMGIANKRANELATASSPGPTGFPTGDYSDEDLAALDQRGLPTANAAGIGLLVGGGVLAAVGVTLIILDRKGKARAGDRNARRSGPRLTGLGPALLPRGGGAAATLRF